MPKQIAATCTGGAFYHSSFFCTSIVIGTMAKVNGGEWNLDTFLTSASLVYDRVQVATPTLHRHRRAAAAR